jgi:hypothetical protein
MDFLTVIHDAYTCNKDCIYLFMATEAKLRHLFVTRVNIKSTRSTVHQ